jgi:hypothetical protein
MKFKPQNHQKRKRKIQTIEGNLFGRERGRGRGGEEQGVKGGGRERERGRERVCMRVKKSNLTF